MQRTSCRVMIHICEHTRNLKASYWWIAIPRNHSSNNLLPTVSMGSWEVFSLQHRTLRNCFKKITLRNYKSSLSRVIIIMITQYLKCFEILTNSPRHRNKEKVKWKAMLTILWKSRLNRMIAAIACRNQPLKQAKVLSTSLKRALLLWIILHSLIRTDLSPLFSFS